MMKHTIFESVLIFTLFLSLIQFAFVPKSVGEVRKMFTIAHRGASGYAPENTIMAFDKAVDMKADYIEIDVQRSKDGKLVIIHDTKVNRTTNGEGYVKDLTYAELQNLDAGSWMGDEFDGAKIPSFEEVLDRYLGKIGILIEIKAPKLYPGIEEDMAKILKGYHLDKVKNEEIIIQSFHFESMKKMKRLLPYVPIGVLISKKENATVEAVKDFSSYADYYNPSYAILTEDLVRTAKAEGMKVLSWTVRSPETAEYLLGHNIDAIATDYPDYVMLEK
ncbi:glycerophosphodiester phosphodiesterase [Niallia endozanthoxylica]|uniref:Glycerophosphodiester phosphodiesterase n=1 Tax=Niallia endozanthoxylica TaxID=2036016 RepID=A0A5J5HLC4_9BACI|nr:glycerophosphodiester phosphodiesterase family protein [Niallia endozanthoxylica]KAA9021614.1 glycerophosphodiester phosphodiesterase [Niallia endozanthoxylica]